MESLLRSIVMVILSPVDVAFPSDLLSEIQSASTFIVYLMSPNCSKLETKSVLLVSKSPKFKVVGFTVNAFVILFNIASTCIGFPASTVTSFLFAS